MGTTGKIQVVDFCVGEVIGIPCRRRSSLISKEKTERACFAGRWRTVVKALFHTVPCVATSYGSRLPEIAVKSAEGQPGRSANTDVERILSVEKDRLEDSCRIKGHQIAKCCHREQHVCILAALHFIRACDQAGERRPKIRDQRSVGRGSVQRIEEAKVVNDKVLSRNAGHPGHIARSID